MKPALVLDAGYGGLGIARSLGRMGAPVFATGSRSGMPGLASRYWVGTFIWDFSVAPAEQSVSFLLDLGRRIGRRAVLMPTSDVTAALVAENAGVLERHYVFSKQDARLVHMLINKRELHQLAGRMALAVPRTAFPLSYDGVKEFADAAVYPVIVKGVDPRRPGGTVKIVVDGPAELTACYDGMADPANPNLMLQEYIPGDEESVWMFNGYFDDRSRCLMAFTGRKLRQYPARAGVTSLGVCEGNDELQAQVRRFLEGIGYCGAIDVDYCYDARDGLYKLLDVNPRIGATFRLFVDANGLDVARAYYFDATGEPVVRAAPRHGRRWMLEEDVLTCVRSVRGGRLGVVAWARSLRGVEETAWIAIDDPAPFLARVWWSVRRVVSSEAGSRTGAQFRPVGPEKPR